MGEGLACPPSPPDQEGRLHWERASLDATLVPAKGGAGVGLTPRGNGSKLMLVAQGQGLPSGLLVEGAQESEAGLAGEALATARVARLVGRSRTGPEGLWPTRAEAATPWAGGCGPAPQALSSPGPGRPGRGRAGGSTSRATDSAGSSRGPSPGWAASPGWW